MQMTPEEICRHYGQASNKTKDIKVLADLNATDPASIRAILIEGGVLPPDPPKRTRKPRVGAPAEVPSAQAAAKAPPPDASVFGRVERILDALPATAGQATRTRAYNLVMALLADDIAGRLDLERVEKSEEAL